MKYRSNRVWKEHEKYQLWLAYYLKTPLIVMSEHFNRTTTSLNKYLLRSGIRESVTSDKTRKKRSCRIRKASELESILISCGLDKETVGLERQHTRNWQPSTFTRLKLGELGLKLPCPWENAVKKDKLPKISGVGKTSRRQPWVFVSLEAICNYLIRNGYAVSRVHKENPYQWTHLLNNKPATDAQLLLEVNGLRIKKCEPIFLVKGLTYEF